MVNLGSQIQGLPHIGVAHIGPVIKTKDIKIVPISAAANPTAVSYTHLTLPTILRV